MNWPQAISEIAKRDWDVDVYQQGDQTIVDVTAPGVVQRLFLLTRDCKESERDLVTDAVCECVAAMVEFHAFDIGAGIPAHGNGEFVNGH